jgi:ketosteroid isomerase-like protein
LDWNRANGSGDRGKLQAYLDLHANGLHASLAYNQITQLKLYEEQARQRKDIESIHAALNSYQQAFENKNIDQLRRVWPSIPKQEADRNQQSFHAASQIRMSLPDKSIRITGDTALVECAQTIQIVAGGNKQTVANTAAFSMQKQSGVWVIVRISSGKSR